MTPQGMNTTALPPNEDHSSLMTAANYLSLVSAFVTLLIAPVGNGLSLLVMNQKALRGTAAATYLSAMAIADTAVVYFGRLPVVALYYGVTTQVTVNYWTCTMQWFCLFTSGDAAVWLVLALTVDRFIAVWLPHHAKKYCTVKRAVYVCIGIVSLTLLKNLTVLISTEVSTSSPYGNLTDDVHCKIRSNMAHFEVNIRPWIGFALYAFVPIVSVCILNILIIYRLLQVRKRITPTEANPTQTTRGHRDSESSSLTVMFLSVSMLFVICITPSILHSAIINYWVDMSSQHDQAIADILTAVFESLVYIYHSTNFFTYCLTGRRFRLQFIELVRCRKSNFRDAGK